MQYTSFYQSPMGGILLAADEMGLTGLWFEGQKYFARCLDKQHEEREISLFETVKRWLNQYLSLIHICKAADESFSQSAFIKQQDTKSR